MPDVLIRGMEMPHNCLFCPCSFWDERTLALWCHALSTYDDNLVAENVTAIEAHSGKPSKAKRPDWCPLVELPEHGDLIDRDAFRAENEYYLNREFINSKYEDTLDDLPKDAPVVLPSNKEETE